MRVAFTGHRYLKNKSQEPWAFKTLESVALRAMENGADWFSSGGAPYWDWWFLDACQLARWQHAGKPAGGRASVAGLPDGIVISMAIPFKGFLSYYAKKSEADRTYIQNELLGFVEPIVTVTPVPTPDARPQMTQLIHKRNRWLVDNHDIIIGLFDGRKSGGTKATLEYARKKGKKILWLNPAKEEEKWV
jgi:hypothetical protein